MDEEEAREAADAVVRGEHWNQEKGDARLIERLRRFLDDLVGDDDDEGKP